MNGLITRLLVLVAVALAPSIGFHLYSAHQAHTVRQKLAEEQALQLVLLVDAEQQRIIQGTAQVLEVLKSTPSVHDHLLPLCMRLMRNILANEPRYNNVALIGPDGHVTCAARDSLIGLDVSDRYYFREAMRTGGLVVGMYGSGRISGKPGLQVAEAYRDETGEIAGVLEISLNLAWLGQELGRVPLPPGAFARIADRAGTILARTQNADAYVGRQILPENRFTLEGSPGVRPSRRMEGQPGIAAFVPPGPGLTGLAVMVWLDGDASFAGLAAADRTDTMLVCTGAVLALLLTALLGHRLIRRPVAQLLAVAGQWRHGNLGVRAPVRRNRAEFGQLAAAFNDMAEALQARDNAVRAALDSTQQSEADLRQLSGELEDRVRKEIVARETAQARAAHAEQVQTLGQLAGGIAHDFNNILQSISGAVNLIEHRAGDTAAVRRFAGLVHDAIGRGVAVTGRLLTFGRRSVLKAGPCDLAELLRGLHEVLFHTLGAHIALKLDVPADLPLILADMRQLETVLVNLATNARDAMPKGGVLTFAASADAVAPGLPRGAYVRLTVADTGVGMDALTLTKAREPFFTTKKLGVGTGLGLTMAQSFAEQSGGALEVHSQPGQGTAVTLWLPRAEAALAPTAPPCPPAPAMGGAAKRLLVVDDEAIILETVGDLLGVAGYEVHTAADGAEALDWLQTGMVDGLVTDLSMPGLDGIALIRAARALYPRLPAILLTGYAGDDAALSLLASFGRSVSLMRKPVTGTELLDRVGTMLAGQRVLEQAD